MAIFYDNSQIFIVERDQILKDNLAIWSHCLEPFLTKPDLTIQLAHKILVNFVIFNFIIAFAWQQINYTLKIVHDSI